MLKIGYFADGPWAHKALARMLSHDSFRIAYIVVRYDSGDAVLANYAQRLGVPLLRHSNVNAPEFLAQISTLGADINVSMSFNQILRREIIDLAPLKFINCHAGALPFYRGRNILNWALINGEDKFGVTVHYVDEGIDTGDIILQKFAPIASTDRYGDLLEKAYMLCAETLYEALLQIEAGEARPFPQSRIHPVGFYCSARRDGDENIDWLWPSERIYNFVRGIAMPAPGARALLEGREAGENIEVIIDRVELVPGAPSYLDKPGNIVGKDADAVIVKTGDSTIRVTSVLDAASSEPLAIGRLRIGQRFLAKEQKLVSMQQFLSPCQKDQRNGGGDSNIVSPILPCCTFTVAFHKEAA